jgi:peroxiredoxin
MDPEKLFVHIVKDYFTRDRAFWADSMEVYALQQRAGEMAQSLVGLKGPDVISKDQFGNTKSIYEKSADYIVVYMYNPTCEHCMKETPLLVEWYNKNKNKGMDVFAIAIDTDENEWKDYIEKNQMNFTNVFDPTNESIYARYYVNVTPEIYVLNKERKIIAKNLKVFQIDEVIATDKSRQ